MMKFLIGLLAFTFSSAVLANNTVILSDYNIDNNYYYACPNNLHIGYPGQNQLKIDHEYMTQYGIPLDPTQGIYQIHCHGYENGVAMVGDDFLLVTDTQMNIILASGYEIDAKSGKVHTFLTLGGPSVGSPAAEPVGKAYK